MEETRVADTLRSCLNQERAGTSLPQNHPLFQHSPRCPYSLQNPVSKGQCFPYSSQWLCCVLLEFMSNTGLYSRFRCRFWICRSPALVLLACFKSTPRWRLFKRYPLIKSTDLRLLLFIGTCKELSVSIRFLLLRLVVYDETFLFSYHLPFEHLMRFYM